MVGMGLKAEEEFWQTRSGQYIIDTAPVLQVFGERDHGPRGSSGGVGGTWLEARHRERERGRGRDWGDLGDGCRMDDRGRRVCDLREVNGCWS